MHAPRTALVVALGLLGLLISLNIVRAQNCPAGQYLDLGQCYECGTGEYQDVDGSGNNVCLKCPKMKYQDLKGQTECKTCAPGSYNNWEGNSGCEGCQPSYEPVPRDNGDYTCEQCQEGFYTRFQGDSPCTECPIGSYIEDTVSNMTCKQCPAGTAAYNASRPAHRCYADAIELGCCGPCEPGTFSSSAGTVQCELCPAGQYQSDSRQTSCLPCPAGTYAANPGSPTCTPTSIGFYQDETGQTSQKACPAGTVGLIKGGKSQEEACKPTVNGRFSFSEKQDRIAVLRMTSYQVYAMQSVGNPAKRVMDSGSSTACGGKVYSRETWYTCSRDPYKEGRIDESVCVASPPGEGQTSGCNTYSFHALADGGFAWVIRTNATDPYVCQIASGQSEVACIFREEPGVKTYTGEWIYLKSVGKADGESITNSNTPSSSAGGSSISDSAAHATSLPAVYTLMVAAAAAVVPLVLLQRHHV